MTKAAELAKMGEVLTNSQIGGRRNIISNGSMCVYQRGSGTLPSGTSLTYYGPDRWRVYKETSTAVATLSQDTDVPSGQGFKYSYKIDVTTADTSVAAGDRCDLIYRFEGQDLQQLKKGNSSAESVTLQFWVKSPKTGTHICEMFDVDNSRQISKAYTVNTADTWEYKTIKFEGDTTGAYDADNANSMQISWWLIAGSTYSGGTLNTSWASNTNANRAVGQVNVLDDTDNNFLITGVQLEVGSQATPFEHRSFGEELRLCQRYFQKLGAGYYAANGLGTTKLSTGFPLATAIRAAPSAVTAPTSQFHRSGNQNSSSATIDSITLAHNSSFLNLRLTGFTSVTDEAPHVVYNNNEMSIDSEL